MSYQIEIKTSNGFRGIINFMIKENNKKSLAYRKNISTIGINQSGVISQNQR